MSGLTFGFGIEGKVNVIGPSRRVVKSVALLVLLLSAPRGVSAHEHLVSPAQVHAQMEAHARERLDALADIGALLQFPVAAEALSRSGLKAADLRPRLKA